MRVFRQSFLIVLSSVFTALFALPVQAATACCVCTLPDKPKEYVCLTGQDPNLCGQIPTTFFKLKGYTCIQPPDPGNCNKVSVASGICAVGPMDVKAFVPKKSPTTGKPIDTVESNIDFALDIPIPGVSFAKDLQVSDGMISSPFLGQYIAAVYKYMIGIAVLAASTMIVYGGFKYIVGSAAPQIQDGKEIIQDAVIGLLLILGAHLILATINPKLVSFDAIKTKAVQWTPMDLEDYGSQMYK